MARIKGMRVYPVDEGVEVWKLDTAKMPLEQTFSDGIIGLEGPGKVRLSIEATRRCRSSTLNLHGARLDLQGFGRFRGVVAARSGSRLPRYLLRAARAPKGTVLHTWLGRRDLNEDALVELTELALRPGSRVTNIVETFRLIRRSRHPCSARMGIPRSSRCRHGRCHGQAACPRPSSAVVSDRTCCTGWWRSTWTISWARSGTRGAGCRPGWRRPYATTWTAAAPTAASSTYPTDPGAWVE